MPPKITLLFFFFFCYLSNSQNAPNFGDLESHKYYVGQLENSKDQDFQRIIGLYDNHIRNHPSEVTAMVERCRFIGNSYYDEYEGYNLKFEETQDCIEQLYGKFPMHPQVLIYRAENLYGEEKLDALQESLRSMSNGKWNWVNIEKGLIYEMLGDYFRYTDQKESLRYYLQAQDLNKDLDVSIPLAESYMETGNDELAKNTILSHLNGDTITWSLNTKAEMLLELGETSKALKLFDEVRQKDSTFIDNSEMAKAMVKLEKYGLAREFLVKDTSVTWNRLVKLQALFNHDLKYSDSGITIHTYRNLQEENSYDDFFAIKRLRIFLKDPFLSWNFTELLHLFFLAVCIAILFILPYIWILPVYNVGLYLKKKSRIVVPKLNFNWGLKHFWILSFIYLLAQFLLMVFFYYEENINAFFEVTMSFEELEEDDASLAKSMLAFVFLMTLGTLAVIKKNVLGHLYKTKIGLWESIKLGVAFVIFNVIFLKVLRSFIPLDPTEISQLLFNATPEIMAILKTYGFGIAVFAVAVLGPIYEEVIFRGVILGSVEKHLGFITANILQASMFAIIHFNLSLFLYYLVFGLITGYYVKRTGGLITGIVLHAINNFFVLVLLSFLVR
ncbi:type II CAAX endopeptidase family protein [Flagellimonas myxillae]|uniref:type II CAAX endopeptidase family protein n=1 Tax=Flagellimonas myxillae TaxID=2942214 RepID=UPI00201E833C|nr:type II CAAX endopeptidase family protein [Muricauda myxillae]MCL6265845.1 CPBP family intramembrane metalloprotease [Muricauda myxillae]